ncbi:MAG: pyrroline-5-carboxylate reductase [Candidatus Thioglobus sp.]|nr:pyrroline-5-carboxylate reductase [Candidatus Thioglobus sp.]
MQKIGFIGAGNMAYALASGLISNGYGKDFIKISDVNKALLSQINTQLGVEIFDNNIALASASEILILAVKPQNLAQVCQELSSNLEQKPLIISIAAGVKSIDIDRWLGGNQALVRVMPNTPALVGQGISGAFANNLVNAQQKSAATTILNAIGECVWVENENLINAVTAVSGSGPAYFFLMLEAMTKAGVDLGLEQAAAEKLSIQTALGSAVMASKSSDSPKVLREKVSSPGGTTQAAINSFQQQNFEQIVSAAMLAAFDRAKEIGDEIGDEIGK